MNRLPLLLVALAGPSLALAEDCPAPVSPNQITSTMQDAMLSFATMDEEEFGAASSKAKAQLPCVNAVFESPRAAAYHRLIGMSGFMQGDREAAAIAFAGALRVEPDFELSGKIAPEGGRLWRVWDAAKQAPASEMIGIDAPSGMTVFVDGNKASKRPSGVPHIVQFVDGSDVVWSGWIAAGGSLPDIAGADPVADADPEEDEWGSSGSEDDEWGSTASDDEWGDMGSKPAPEPEPEPEPDAKIDWDDSAAESDWGDSGAKDDDGWGDGGTDDDVEWTRPPADLDKPDPLPTKPTRPPKETSGGGGMSPLLLAGVGAGVAAGGMLGGAVYFRGQFDENPTAQGFHMTNGTHYASIGTATLAGVLLIAGVASGGN